MQQLSLFEQPKVSMQLSEYSFVLSIPEEISEKMMRFKKILNHKIGISNQDLISLPAVSLLLIPVKDLSGETVKSYAEKGFQGTKKVELSFERAGYFEHGMTKDIIYKFDEPYKVIRIAKRIYENLGLKFDAKKFTPHLTLAKGIERSKLDGFSSLAEFNFKTHFVCDKITILRRELEVYNARIVKRSAYRYFSDIHLDEPSPII